MIIIHYFLGLNVLLPTIAALANNRTCSLFMLRATYMEHSGTGNTVLLRSAEDYFTPGKLTVDNSFQGKPVICFYL